MPSFCHLDGAGQVGVLPHDLGVEAVARKEDHGCGDHHGQGYVRPAEAEIQPRQHEACDEDQPREGLHPLLRRLLFLGIQPLGEEVAGAGEHDDAHDEHGDKEETEEQDAAGVGKGACGEEDQEADQEKANEKFYEGRNQQFHGSFLLYDVDKMGAKGRHRQHGIFGPTIRHPNRSVPPGPAAIRSALAVRS